MKIHSPSSGKDIATAIALHEVRTTRNMTTSCCVHCKEAPVILLLLLPPPGKVSQRLLK